MNNKPLISYILPSYQAETFIYNNLRLFSQFCTKTGIASEIIVVNDGSNDRTNSEVEKFLKEHKGPPSVTYVNLTENRGKGNAIRKGFEASQGQYIIFTDCDLPYSFNNISNATETLITNKANVVIACRMHKDSVYNIRSENLSYIYIRHTSGRIFNNLIKFFTHLDIDDTQAGLKGFDRETAELLFRKMSVTGFSFDIDLLVCANENGKKISEIPIEFNYESEMSTISFVKQTFVMTMGLLQVFFKKLRGAYRE